MVWAMADAMPDGLKMADLKIAEQLGIGKRNVAKVLANLLKKGWLQKKGSHGHRTFFTTTPQSVVLKSNYTSERNQLHPEAKSTTPVGDHKEYKNTENKKDAGEDLLEPSADSYSDVQERRKAMCKNLEPITF